METEQNAYIKRMEESTKAFDIDLLAIVERKKGPSINDVTIFLRRRGQKLRTADDPYGVVQLREY